MPAGERPVRLRRQRRGLRRLRHRATCDGSGCVCPGDEFDCDGSCVDRGTDTAHCGARGTLCPGAGAPFAEPVCLNGDTCGVVCHGDHSDVDGDPGNGCEVDGGVAIHTKETAATATPATPGCDDAATGGFIGMIASDGRAHSPAVEGLDPVTGAAPQWWKVRATGGQCVRDLSVELTMSRATRNCYRLTVTTDKGEVSAVWNGGIEVTGTGTGAYTPDTDIHFKMEKFCSVTTAREAAVYSVSSHL